MIRIIGVGNPLMGDDGAGTALVELLGRRELPPGVEVVDGGTGGVTLLGLMEGAAGVVLVDAADMGRPVGAVVRLTGEEAALSACSAPLSLHQAGVAGALALGRELAILPRLVLFLVQGERVAPGQGLSPPVEAALDSLADRVIAEARLLLG